MNTPAVAQQRTVTLRELSSLLNQSYSTTSRMLADGKLPKPLALPRPYRWSLSAIEAWIADGCPTPGH